MSFLTIPRRGGDSYRALPIIRYFQDDFPLTTVSNVAVILHRFVVFHQQFRAGGFGRETEASGFRLQASGDWLPVGLSFLKPVA
jgi:hypothetical protein